MATASASFLPGNMIGADASESTRAVAALSASAWLFLRSTGSRPRTFVGDRGTDARPGLPA